MGSGSGLRGLVRNGSPSAGTGTGRTVVPRRVFCAAVMFELSDREFEGLWPALERLPNNTERPWDALM